MLFTTLTLKPLVSCSKTALLSNAGKVTVDLTLAGSEAATHLAVADRDAASNALLLAVEFAGVLQALDVGVAPTLAAICETYTTAPVTVVSPPEVIAT